MKKKFIAVLAASALVGLGALSGCSPKEDSKSESTAPTTSEVTSESSESKVSVTGVTLTLDKSTIRVGETANATVTIAPSNATNKAYDLVSSNTAVATVNGDVITALAVGTTNITAVSKDGSISSSAVALTVKAALTENPTLTLTGETTYTVAAGTNLTLPTVKAVARDGETDLSSDVEVEDYDDPKAISSDLKTFNSKIAGTHTVSYYVQEGDGEDAPSDEKKITITVTPATANTFETKDGDDDANAMKNYKTFKDGFEKGTSSVLYKSLGDANNATELSATSDAVMGNSLIIDMNKTAGSALNSVFINTFTDTLIREKPVTYEVSFDYKALDDTDYTGVYFGQRWDNYDGTNVQFMSNKTVGQVNHFSQKFTEVKIPSSGNAGFFFFKLSADSKPTARIAIDNFVVTATKCVETTDVIPTSDQLSAEGGFTFNWKDKANKFTKGETIELEDAPAEAKTAMKAATGFSTNVMHLTGNDNHTFSGVNSTNLVAGKKLTISFNYYCVKDAGLNMIMMTSAGNPTMNDGLKTEVISGSIKKFTWSGTIPTGAYTFNIYPTDSSFDIYAGDMTLTLTDADPVAEDQTEKGYQVGKTWENKSRTFGNKDDSTLKITNGVTTPDGAKGKEGIGDTMTKFEFLGSNLTAEWCNYSGNAMENGHTYTIKTVYYVETISAGTRICFNFDNNVFLDLDTEVGYHSKTITWVANRNVDFVSFYIPGGASGNTVFYVASTLITLTAI